MMDQINKCQLMSYEQQKFQETVTKSSLVIPRLVRLINSFIIR